jgi:peptidoglycan-N-acetylglucosamine deacetylase
MDDEVKKVIGIKPTLFRPPYGVTNPNLKTAIVKGKYSAIGWSVRSMDTVIKDEKKLLTKVTAAIQPGAVFLFHDTSIATIKMLPTFLQEVKKRGYKIVPLDKLLHLKPYE